MKNTSWSTPIIITSLLILVLQSCEKTENDRNLISAESIRGKWLLETSRSISGNLSEVFVDTTYVYGNSVMQINDTNTCDVYDLGDDVRYTYWYSVIEPDTFVKSACPMEVLCDPFYFNVRYKILVFDSNKEMILRHTRQYTIKPENEPEYVRMDTTILTYSRYGM